MDGVWLSLQPKGILNESIAQGAGSVYLVAERRRETLRLSVENATSSGSASAIDLSNECTYSNAERLLIRCKEDFISDYLDAGALGGCFQNSASCPKSAIIREFAEVQVSCPPMEALKKRFRPTSSTKMLAHTFSKLGAGYSLHFS